MSAPARAKVVVVGGCGRVGLPLSIALAPHFDVAIYDIDASRAALVREGKMPFEDAGAAPALIEALGHGLQVHTTREVVRDADYVVLVIGTPVDAHLSPNFTLFLEVIAELAPVLRSGQVVVLRSTVYPGTTELVRRRLVDAGLDLDVVFCPERVAEGKALEEIRALPQLVSGFTPRGLAAARALFAPIGCELVELPAAEAELAKLYTNAWRYITFATANQFYMLSTRNGLDHGRILHAMRHGYPRAAGLPGPGFAAGPCLAKDTMHLSAFAENQFALGHAAMWVNEGMPGHVVRQMKSVFPDLARKTVAILGMAFKPGSDDPRESLSYKLRNILRTEAREVLCTDPRVPDPTLVTLEEALSRSDILAVGAPHPEYRGLDTRGKAVFDVWQSGIGHA